MSVESILCVSLRMFRSTWCLCASQHVESIVYCVSLWSTSNVNVSLLLLTITIQSLMQVSDIQFNGDKFASGDL